ncbi:cation efflux system protein [Ameyamaea chiangmaiensis NBRC 103196]|uniref:Cation diffusion facilitator family transporter n=1 Tax=Ameyamaea chiangmaiensis TaxID=442969 RepID=A0A850PGL1_9PROT|nr:cation diffusion facilitator family transporter [Ameyamaea chiangmaiensis]MBS4074364.1 cation diffusion facilitator family transporter [Ameyamaea chiangmaiensis]NVN41022.1 cation diffusion facilitator family transporter [Ameyamaea chiangmaiensis]GBQ71790.1 cation efflux system protein [Ameyamaea chiangmaiensis NBRC 103196]
MSDHGSTRVVLAALLVNVSIAIVKAIASALSGSAAMFAETIHSFVDCANQLLMLLGIRRARRAPDERHPLGYHREIYFWSFVVALFIFAGGGVSALSEGLDRVRSPEPLSDYVILGRHLHAWLVNLILLVVCGALESQGFVMAVKGLRAAGRPDDTLFSMILRSPDPALFVVLCEDGAALIGLLIAAVATLATAVTGNPVFDGIGSLLTGVLLIGVSCVLFNETRSLIVGESSRVVTEGVRSILRSIPDVTGVNEVITEYRGPDAVIVLLSIDWDDRVSAETVERHVSEIEAQTKARFPRVSKMFIEAQSAQASQADMKAFG